MELELKNKEAAFRKIQKQMNDNSKSILIYRKISPALMILFVINAFLMFYFNVNKFESNLKMIFVSMLLLTFLMLSLFRYSIIKKIKENRSLDTEIYNLLRL